MRIDENLKIHLARSADIAGAVFCGVFAAAGALSLAAFWTFPDRGGIIRALLLASFALIAICGIFGRPRLMPKACFSLSLTVTALVCPPFLADAVQIVLCPLMVLTLLFGARWRGARLAIFPLILLVGFAIFRAELPATRGEKIPLSLYLPSSLLHERSGGVMLIFDDPDPEADELLACISFRSGWLRMNFPRVTLGFEVTKKESGKFRIAIAGRSSRLGGVPSRKYLYRWLTGKLEADGVLILPVDETAELPPGDWRMAVLSGGGGRWAAARRGRDVCVDPGVLDDRIKEFSSSEHSVLSAGAFSAMYLPPPERGVTIPERRSPWFADAWRWALLAAVARAWIALRLMFCRLVKICTAAAAAETAAAMVLYTLAIFPKWSECMMDTGISPFALFAGVGLLLLPRPFSAVRNGMRIMAEAAVGILPWLPGCSWCWLPLISWFCWFFAGSAVFTGIRHDDRRAALFGALTGVALGVLLHFALDGGGSSLPVCIAVLLMVPSWLRR
ncbi:MAG: hypothetical protein J6Y54_00480 [Lentisphaeria bacterium]|nr:hypothetical protein [Lentisphaeria bacterium]